MAAWNNLGPESVPTLSGMGAYTESDKALHLKMVWPVRLDLIRLQNLSQAKYKTNFVKGLAKSSGRIPKILCFQSIPLITFVPVQV